MLLAEEANRANEAKSEFLSKIAHDIRTPMNAVMGFADIAKIAQTTHQRYVMH